MSNMYVNITGEGRITDITNNKFQDNEIYLGVKYIIDRDAIVFTAEDGKIYAERSKGGKVIYKYEFEEAGEYMLTPFFVDTYKSNHPAVRDIYAFLKRHFKGKFYLEENNSLTKGYQIVFNSWVDVTFDYKFKVSVNTNIINEEDVYTIREYLLTMKTMDLLKLYNNINGRSIFIDQKSLGIMKSIDSLFTQSVETVSN